MEMEWEMLMIMIMEMEMHDTSFPFAAFRRAAAAPSNCIPIELMMLRASIVADQIAVHYFWRRRCDISSLNMD